MDSDVYGEGGFFCGLAEAEDEGGAAHGPGEGDGFGWVGGYIVCCFGEEKCLGSLDIAEELIRYTDFGSGINCILDQNFAES